MAIVAEPAFGSSAPGELQQPLRRGAAIHELKQRDNVTNILHLAWVYVVMLGAIAAAIAASAELGSDGAALAVKGLVVALAIVAVGASQHQLGGAIHEATHFTLFANRRLNELASDWLAAFPIYTSTFHFRLHHLAHHQFVNDPLRDPDFSQLEDSGHALDFPIAHIDFLRALLRQLWLPNLVRYTIVRARYSALGAAHNPYLDPRRKGARMPVVAGVLYAAVVPVVAALLTGAGHGMMGLGVVLGAALLVISYYALIPADRFPQARIEPVISHRATGIGRIAHMALLYGGLTLIEMEGMGPAWAWFGLLWIVPLFTTFPLFMILRQWVQHGNADRGRLTNTRVFLVGPLTRYAVFPFGMDLHLPHHIYASVPHYRLRELHDLLLLDPEYRKRGIVTGGFLRSLVGGDGRPTILDVLGPAFAPATRAAPHVDDAALADVEISDRAALESESQQSRSAG